MARGLLYGKRKGIIQLNEIFVIDPKATDQARDPLGQFHHLLDKFGFGTGVFIGGYPNNWANKVLGEFAHLKGTERSKLVILLKNIEDSVYPVKGIYKDQLHWIENALRLKDIKKEIEGVITSAPRSEKSFTVEEVLDKRFSQKYRRSILVKKEVDNYTKVSKLLIELSTELFLADRFFHLRRQPRRGEKTRSKKVINSPRFKKLEDYDKYLEMNEDSCSLLKGFIRIANWSKKTKRFRVLFSEIKWDEIPIPRKIQNELIDRDLKRIVKEEAINDLEVDFVLLPREKSEHHPRYLFSMKGGLEFGSGFDFFKKTEKNKITWIDEADLQLEFDYFSGFFPEA